MRILVVVEALSKEFYVVGPKKQTLGSLFYYIVEPTGLCSTGHWIVV